MTIRHLQIFKAVAEAGKMGQAARQLYISQPTVSKAIGDLEKEYGVLLFDRLAQKLYITEAGTRLLRYARQLLALYDEMEADLHAAAGLQAIRVGATITVGSCVLPALIRRFEQEHPGVRVQVEVESARRIEQKILNSELDLAVSEGEPESGELLAVPVIRDELVLISNPAHPLAGRETVPPAALNGEPFVLREEGSGTRAGLDRFLQDNGLQVYPKWTCQSFDAVLCSNSFHHYPHPEKFFSEAARVLRPGGRLILRDYTSNDFAVWLMNNIELPLARLMGHGDVRISKVSELRALAEGAGLTVLKLEAQKGFRAHLVARKE